MLAIPNLVLVLLLFSLPFALVSVWSRRQWTLGLPSLVWGGLAILQTVGAVTIYSGSVTLVAGVLIASGTLFALAGLLVGRSRTASRPA
ncbi:hypothetical protein BH23CHL7_BH23CHL7_24100 [soil metagenome]